MNQHVLPSVTNYCSILIFSQHGVPDKDVFVRRGIRQEDDVYHVEAEVKYYWT